MLRQAGAIRRAPSRRRDNRACSAQVLFLDSLQDFMTPYVPPDAHRPAVRRFIRPDWAPQAESLGDVRRRIDDIDQQMVSLLVQRALCVRDATRFKLDLHQVAAPERQAEVFARVRALAAAHEDQFPGLGDVADATWRAMVQGFVACEGRLMDQTEWMERG